MNIIGYGKLSNWMNKRYWNHSHILSGEKQVTQEKLESLNTVLKLKNFMKGIKYSSDSFHGIFHWWQNPLTTIHRGKGDCEDAALLWYDRLFAIGYEAKIVLYYKCRFGINWPMHFICIWKENNQYYTWWRLASNSDNNWYSVPDNDDDYNILLNDYCCAKNYSKYRVLKYNEFMKYKEN